MSIPLSSLPPDPAARNAETSEVPAPLWTPTATAYALADVVRTCAREFGCDLCAVMLGDGEPETLAAYGQGRETAEVTVVFGDAVPLPPETPKTIGDLENGRRRPFRSRLCIPLRTERDRVGTVILCARRQGAFDWAGEAHRRAVGELAGARIAEACRHDRTQRLAFVDGLTGFFSRAYYFERLAEAIAYAERYGETLAVVAYDYDGLKRANETHGYEAGSQLMADTTRDQRRYLRRSDIPCRIMGDEFAVIALHTDMAGGQALARQLQTAAEALKVCVLPKNTRTGTWAAFHSAISVGVAALEIGDVAETLTSRALRAVQADKARRRARSQSLQLDCQEGVCPG